MVAAFLYSALAFCQKPEHDFYTEFRNTWNPKVRAESPSVTNQQIVEKYAARLKGEGVADAEIAHRMRLIETERPLMEANYYNRFYTQGKTITTSNPIPSFRRWWKDEVPGAALDYGMGDGGTPSTWPSSDGVFGDSTLPTRPSGLLRSEPKNLVSH